ncbi:MAG: hypothetical protein R2748_15520 [Bryobacterales bacterium]
MQTSRPSSTQIVEFRKPSAGRLEGLPPGRRSFRPAPADKPLAAVVCPPDWRMPLDEMFRVPVEDLT